ncbi:hypothetical protein T552_02997 [Pneumocystis carinii B80]|uniref:RNA helicase n=1 Tax=Pneumocystis carinii (strain B80) TaxID=1408658 RepID=A0A0W4ZCP6_PNEC8|nr:hypothetical protein T552_02997 [Pneumocystis carinii B80]KTW26103.1 hypothetical protein T552_02997 [Pneumocystis carinii B80]
MVKYKNKERTLECQGQESFGSDIYIKNGPLDANVEMILPDEQKQKKKLKEQMMSFSSRKKMSSKKKKRLDKYIENKLRKYEKADLMLKLSQYKHKSGMFYSSKNIGRKEKRKKYKNGGLSDIGSTLSMSKDSTDCPPEQDLYMSENESVNPLINDSKQTEETQDMILNGTSMKRNSELACVSFSILEKKKKQKKQNNWREIVALRKGKGLHQLEDVKESTTDQSMDRDSEELESNDEEMADDDVQPSFSSKSDESSVNSNIQSDNDLSANESLSFDATNVSEKPEGFNEWAKKQMEIIEKKNDNPTNIDSLENSRNAFKTFIPRDPFRDLSPPPENISSNPDFKRKAFYVNIKRSEDVEEIRSNLPIILEEQQIMEAIFNNLCVVISGETGSGKTTQIPQFLFEAGFGNDQSDTPGMIGVTQPRRVAAISMANRVAYELGELGEKVAYQVRFNTNIKSSTAIKFMTDGILLHELSSDFLLRKYSVIIIDEAHERTINTDILIGVLSRVLKLRQEMSMEKNSDVKPLKLIIMSATLRIDDFINNNKLFNPPPVLIKIGARQYPVSIHFSRKTVHLNYVEKSFEIVCKIHRKLPPGAILVFLTGQNEIKHMCKLLSRTFPQAEKTTQSTTQLSVKFPTKEGSLEAEDIEFDVFNGDKVDLFEEDDDVDMDNEDEYNFDMPLDTSENIPNILKVIPLYSLLPTEEQLKVFEPVPKGVRLCVIATNIAETSLTIPNVRYVVDSGRVKECIYDEISGVQSFNIQWISKASADQRSGRAGRIGPGHCYRLYSSAFFDREFLLHSKPEILRMPIEGVVLKMKSMNIDNILNFPFPTPPEERSLKKAIDLLMCLGALDKQHRITNLGKVMSLFPLAPRYAKMLIIGQQHECLPYIIAIVSALSVDDPFMRKNELENYNINNGETSEEESDYEKEKSVSSFSEKEDKLKKRSKYIELSNAHKQFCGLDSTSDILKLLSAVCAYAYDGEKDDFCIRNFLRIKSMKEIQKLRHQITDILKLNFPSAITEYNAILNPPSTLQINAIKQIVAASFIDHIAIRGDLLPNSIQTNSKSKIIYTPYFTLFPTISKHTDSMETNDDPAVYLHSSSIMTNITDPRLFPKYIIYHTLYRSSNSSKVRIKALTTVEPNNISGLAKSTPLLTYSKPLEYPCPQLIPESDGLKRKCWVIPRLCPHNGQGNKSWDLPPKLITQKRIAGSRWEIIDD